MFQIERMARVEDQKLLYMALAVVEEVAARSAYAPQPRTRGLALALAFLASRTTGPARYPFDQFWRTVQLAGLNDRRQLLRLYADTIYKQLGCEPDIKLRHAFEQLVREEIGDRPGLPCGGEQ